MFAQYYKFHIQLKHSFVEKKSSKAGIENERQTERRDEKLDHYRDSFKK